MLILDLGFLETPLQLQLKILLINARFQKIKAHSDFTQVV
jgi:hypothetical protein